MRQEKFFYFLNKKTGEVIQSDEKPSTDWKRIKRSEYYHRIAAQLRVQRTAEKSGSQYGNSTMVVGAAGFMASPRRR